jgi:hypothetical protein
MQGTAGKTIYYPRQTGEIQKAPKAGKQITKKMIKKAGMFFPLFN